MQHSSAASFRKTIAAASRLTVDESRRHCFSGALRTEVFGIGPLQQLPLNDLCRAEHVHVCLLQLINVADVTILAYCLSVFQHRLFTVVRSSNRCADLAELVQIAELVKLAELAGLAEVLELAKRLQSAERAKLAELVEPAEQVELVEPVELVGLV